MGLIAILKTQLKCTDNLSPENTQKAEYNVVECEHLSRHVEFSRRWFKVIERCDYCDEITRTKDW